MDDEVLAQPPLHERPLNVAVLYGEILLVGAQVTDPSLTASAARETGRRLIEAADQLDRMG